MAEHVWKRLPYAIYLDTNVLRASGPRLDAAWINELLSITTEYNISVCIAELVLAEWCEYVAGELEKNRQKLLSSADLLQHYGIAVHSLNRHEIKLPEREQLVTMITDKLEAVGIGIIPNWDAPLSKLLTEAVTKVPPFEAGGKGLCDAVIVESYVQHAKDSFSEPRVLVVSRDNAVKRSGVRFTDRGVVVDFVDEDSIVGRLMSLLDDEVAAFIEREKTQVREYVMAYEPQVLEFLRKTPLKVTDWMLNPLFLSEGEERIEGTIESILSIKPTRIVNVIGGTPGYGEETLRGRYPLQISVELEMEVVVREYGFGFGTFGRTRAIVQPDMVDGSSPITLEATSIDWKGRETTKTIRRRLSVMATLDAEKQKEGELDDFKIERVI